MSEKTITLCFHEDAGQVDRTILNDIITILEKGDFSVTQLNLADATNEEITSNFNDSDIVIAYGGDGTVHHVTLSNQFSNRIKLIWVRFVTS